MAEAAMGAVGGPACAESTYLPSWCELALGVLRWSWGDAYDITVVDELWLARRKDQLGMVTGSGPDELHIAIVEDYTFHRVRLEAP